MSRYLLRRALVSMPALLGISVVLFTVLALAPGDPFEELATNPNVPPEVRQNLRAKFGLDDPLPVRYARWFTSMLRAGFSRDWLPFRFGADFGALPSRWSGERCRQWSMPAAAPGPSQAAAMTRFIRAAALDVIRPDNVNTARAKALPEKTTLVK